MDSIPYQSIISPAAAEMRREFDLPQGRPDPEDPRTWSFRHSRGGKKTRKPPIPLYRLNPDNNDFHEGQKPRECDHEYPCTIPFNCKLQCPFDHGGFPDV